MLEEMTEIFKETNKRFLESEESNIMLGVAERNLCGAMMLHMRRVLDGTAYEKYHVDVEYNRNEGGRLKTIVNGKETPIPITCDLIAHSRGENIEQDNLIAIEMKRNSHPKSEKDKDKIRLKCLTRDSYDNLWSYDGKTFPEHVCRYILGVYYELNVDQRKVSIHYYAKGKHINQYDVTF
ncbi:hypothetical protein [Vreelandella sulfidaeris]|uniref:hypothetical protein n=1 Tax=Vreelandella sulfidaeris TaxID=115553 RepID=UPI0035E88B2E